MAKLFDSKFDTNEVTVFTFKTGQWRQNSYMILNNKSFDVYFVDPGGDFDRLKGVLEKHQGCPRAVFLTHAHHDHVGALKQVCDNFKIPFYMHRNDQKILKRAPLFAFSFESRIMVIPSEQPEFYDSILPNNSLQSFNFIETPGHTEGGVVVQIGDIAFTGDTLLNKMIGRTDLPGSCREKLADSIEKFLALMSDETILFPGHGLPWMAKEAKAWWAEHKNNIPEYRSEDENTSY